MTVETRDTEFRHPEAVAFLRSLTDEAVATHPPLVRVMTALRRYWREGGRVCCREVASGARASIVPELRQADLLPPPPPPKNEGDPKGDPNRRLIRLVTKKPKSGEFYFGIDTPETGELYFRAFFTKFDPVQSGNSQCPLGFSRIRYGYIGSN